MGHLSPLEDAMNTLIDVFRSHSHRDGDGDYLSRREMRELFNAELGQFLTVLYSLSLSLSLYISLSLHGTFVLN
uniref:S100/CaBP-9k-type calcium binding subdomain domain-containing protein n=1 Tax=Labrus bergylta TaxID=56723 RepID=A0A3Q3MY06_9LABR